jgi:hypothetical protein
MASKASICLFHLLIENDAHIKVLAQRQVSQQSEYISLFLVYLVR